MQKGTLFQSFGLFPHKYTFVGTQPRARAQTIPCQADVSTAPSAVAVPQPGSCSAVFGKWTCKQATAKSVQQQTHPSHRNCLLPRPVMQHTLTACTAPGGKCALHRPAHASCSSPRQPPVHTTACIVLGPLPMLLGRCRPIWKLSAPLAVRAVAISCSGSGLAGSGVNSSTLQLAASSAGMGKYGSNTGPGGVTAAAAATAVAAVPPDVLLLGVEPCDAADVCETADAGGVGFGWCISLRHSKSVEPCST